MDVALAPPTADLAPTDGSGSLLARLRGIGATGAPSADLADAATEFEAYLIQSLLARMRDTVDEDGLFSSLAGGHQALIDGALSRHLARAGGLGLADQLVRQWQGAP
jgi:flagellar protein FlgJ